MSTYKLTYFDVRAKGEPARYMFELAGVKYEDIRVTDDEWKELKPSFYPSGAWESAQVDTVVETINEFDPDIAKWFESDDAEKEHVIETFMTEKAPKRFGNLEKLLLKNKDGKGWFVGDKISVADVVTFSMLHDLLPVVIGSEVGGLDLKAYPALSAFIDRFKAEKKISDWIKKRPVTKF